MLTLRKAGEASNIGRLFRAFSASVTGRIQGIVPRGPPDLIDQRHPEVFLGPSGSLEAWGTNAKQPHICRKTMFLENVWSLGLGTPGFKTLGQTSTSGSV